jgi:hypothetical protein
VKGLGGSGMTWVVVVKEGDTVLVALGPREDRWEAAEGARARKNPYTGPGAERTFAYQQWELSRAWAVLYYEWVALLRVDRIAEWLTAQLSSARRARRKS